MKTSLSLLFLLTFSMQLMSQAFNVKTDKSPGDIAITSIQHPCIGTVNGVDTTLGYFSALPVDQVWPIQLSAFIVNLGPTDQTNVVLTGEIVNELGTVVYTSSQLGGNLNAGFNMILTLPDLFLPTATGSYTLRMSVIQDEGDYDLTNNEMTRLILDVNANGVISRIFEMNAAIEIPTGAGTVLYVTGIKFAIPNDAKLKSLSVYIDTMIQPQTYLVGYLFYYVDSFPVVLSTGESFEITTSSNNSWVDIPFSEIDPTDLELYSQTPYLVGIEAYSDSGMISIGADNADFHEFEVESFFDGYLTVQTKIPAIKINLKYDIGAESPNLVDNIHIYPNPVTDILCIETPSKTGELRLMNAFGQLLAIQSIQDTNTRLDLSAQPAGVYTLQIKDKSKILKTNKLIKLTSH